MTLRELQYVLAVAEHGHFGRAAEAACVSQPTLSGQLKKLERELGVVIFERGRKGAVPTPDGVRIIAAAREVIAAARRVHAIADAAQDPLAGELSLGLIPTIAPYLIPRFVSRLSRALPKLNTTYREDVTDRLNASLLEGRLDAAVLATDPLDDGLEVIPLYREPFWLVVPEGHDLADTRDLRMRELATDEMLLLTEGHCFRDQALAICRPVQEMGGGRLRATSLETLVNLVASGQGLTLVPELAMRDVPGTQACALEEPGAARVVNLTFRKSFPRPDLLGRIADVIRDGVRGTAVDVLD